MNLLPIVTIWPVAALIMLLAVWPTPAMAAEWQDRFREIVLAQNDAVTKAEWITRDIFWAAVPDTGETQDDRAQTLCGFLEKADPPADAHFRIHLWSAQQRTLGDGIVLGEAQCPDTPQ